MSGLTRFVVVLLAASAGAASLMSWFAWPTGLLPAVLAVLGFGAWHALRMVDLPVQSEPATRWEVLLLGVALLTGLLRLVPYAGQYVSGGLVAGVTWDDHWHFQQIASLVTSDHFPPRLNFEPDSYLHFYYLPWIPSAALSVLADGLVGRPLIKLTYGLGALGLNLASAWAIVLFVRHTLAPQARAWALVAIAIAGAAPDAWFVMQDLTTGRSLVAEWWQDRYYIHNQFSSLTTVLVWVPHHLIAAAALLLAVVVATEPGTLRLRRSVRALALAGALTVFSTFASIFVCLGAAVTFSPWLMDLARREHRAGFVVATGIVALLSAPLAYLYVNADAASGLVLGQPYASWRSALGSHAGGVAGVGAAVSFMMAEVGWLYAATWWLAGRRVGRERLDRAGVLSFLFLLSTSVIGFSSSNNYAMRGAIVPALVVCCCWASRVSAVSSARHERSARAAFVVRVAAATALALAAVAHVGGLAQIAEASAASFAYVEETEACKREIRRRNDAPASAGPTDVPSDCVSELSSYHLERPFRKATLSGQDRELTGRGPMVFR